MRFLKKIAGRGHVTLPSDVRDAMGIQEGDIIEFQIVGVVRRRGENVPETTSSTAPAVPQ